MRALAFTLAIVLPLGAWPAIADPNFNAPSTLAGTFDPCPAGSTIISGVPGAYKCAIGSATLDTSDATHAPQYCQITVTTTATRLALLLAAAGCLAIPSWATSAWLTPELSGDSNGFALRYRTDGVNPTASVGQPVFGITKDPALLGYNAVVNAVLISTTVNEIVNVQIGG